MHEKYHEIFWPNEKDLKALAITLSGHKKHSETFYTVGKIVNVKY